jgi:hypothetical protein
MSDMNFRCRTQSPPVAICQGRVKGSTPPEMTTTWDVEAVRGRLRLGSGRRSGLPGNSENRYHQRQLGFLRGIR